MSAKQRSEKFPMVSVNEVVPIDQQLLDINDYLAANADKSTGLLAAAAAAADGTPGLPPLSNAQRTQIAGTLPTYQKAADILGTSGPGLDYGAGLGLGARELGFDAFEPFPREGFVPTYTDPAAIPSQAYDRLTNFNVLNVVPREVRDDIVENIGRVIAPGGRGLITTRGRDVLAAKGTPGPEPMSLITSRDTYQKGFLQQELQDYLRYILGSDFEVSPLRLGPAGAEIRRVASAPRTRTAANADKSTGLLAAAAADDAVALPKFREDLGPNDAWLQGKLARAAKNRAEYGAEGGSLGNLGGQEGVTGWFDEPVMLDPQALKNVRGVNGEEVFRDTGQKLANLKKSIASEGYKPSPILIVVREDGVPFIAEGNHRLAEAIQSGRPGIPVEVKYLRGGQAADGPLNPNQLPLMRASTNKSTGLLVQ